jgi:hypothetical protein
VDTLTGEELWAGTARVVHNSQGGAGGGGIIGAVVVAAVKAAITASTVQYRPIAFQTNKLAVNRAGYGLPAGPYHPQYQKDREQFQ